MVLPLFEKVTRPMRAIPTRPGTLAFSLDLFLIYIMRGRAFADSISIAVATSTAGV
jgi:hypothetical protein